MVSKKVSLCLIALLSLLLFGLVIARQQPVAAEQTGQLSSPILCEKVYLPLIIDQASSQRIDVGEGFAPPPQPQGAVECQTFADFNGDGYDDLAIGVILENIANGGAEISNAGALNIINGSQDGLTASGDQILSRPTADATYLATAEERLGEVLATGDFDSDGFTDLAVGIPRAEIEGDANAGAVQIYYGTATGFETPLPQNVFSQAGAISGAVEADDIFGEAITAGDFNGDGYDDLAVGSPGERVGSGVGSLDDAGAVNIIFGSEDGLTETNNEIWVEDDLGLFGVSQESDGFGSALTTADFDQDGYDDLAIGIPYQDLGFGTIIEDAGAVFIMPGSPTGPGTDGLQFWSQSGDVGGIIEEGDRFGTTLTTGDFNGDSYPDLAIGLPFEDVDPIDDAGAVNILFGSASGLNVSGNQIFHADDAGFGATFGAGENYQFGFALTAGDYNGDGYSDLTVGIPFQNFGVAPGPITFSVGAAVSHFWWAKWA